MDKTNENIEMVIPLLILVIAGKRTIIVEDKLFVLDKHKKNLQINTNPSEKKAQFYHFLRFSSPVVGNLICQ